MALVILDRAKETTTTTGTGSVTLLGAVTGSQSLAGVGNGNTTYYCIADQSGANWEVGVGTYSTTGPTLSRTTVLASSNAGALVTFTAGTKDVFITYPAERAIYANAANVNSFYASGSLLNTQYFTTASQSVTLTIASPCVVTATTASVPQNGSQIVFATTGALPTGLTAGTVYYVVGSSGTTFNVALTVGGGAITTSGTQSGTQSISSGTYTPTAGTNSVIVETIGGGGGSGGAAADIGLASGGGGGGGYAKKKITSAFSGVTVTVGLGGTAGTSGPNAGGAGGTSSFGALISSTGGAGGSGASVGFKGVYVALGGSGSSGDFNFSGGASFAISSGNTTSFSSTGGASFYSGLISTAYVASNVNGTVGNQYGGGASGALCKTASTQSGATGASGIVIVYEYA